MRHTSCALCVLAVACALSGLHPRPASAADVTATWLDGTGNWTDPTQWDSNPLYPDNGYGGFTYDAILNSGSAALDQDIVIEGFTLGGGTLTGGYNLTINNLMNWTAGTLTGTGATKVGASSTLSMTGASTKSLGWTLINAGTAALMDTGNLYNWGGAVVDNLSGATFDVQGDADIVGSAPATFNNAGLFKKSGGSGLTYFETGWAFNNTGTVEVDTGTLGLRGGGISPGLFSVSPGASLIFTSGIHDLTGATFVNAGRVRFLLSTIYSQGPLTLPGTVDLSGANLSGSGTVTVEGTMTWNGGTMSGTGLTEIAGGGNLLISTPSSSWRDLDRNLNNAGMITMTGTGSLRSDTGAVLNNLPGGTFDVKGDAGFYWNAANTFNNAGLFRKSAGSGMTSLAWGFNNSGKVEVQSGTLEIYIGGTSNGVFSVSPGATLAFGNGTHHLGGTTFVNSGKVWFEDCHVDLNGPLALPGEVLFSNHSTLSGPGAVTVGGTMTWTNGTMTGPGVTEIAPAGEMVVSAWDQTKNLGRTLINGGTAVVESGIPQNYLFLNAEPGGGVVNLQGATFELQSSSGLGGDSPAIFTNAGLLRKSASAGTAALLSNWTLNSTGTVEVQSGTLNIYGPYVQTGGATILQGGTLNIYGPYVQTGGATILQGGTTLGTSMGLEVQGGSIQGLGTICGNVSSAGTVSPGDSPGTLTVNGNYTQAPTGRFEVEIGGLSAGSEFDRLAISGSASLAGTMNISLINGFVPAEGNAFAVMTYGSRAGTFGTVTGRHLPGGLDFGLQYRPGDLTLVVAVPRAGDADWDGNVDFADYLTLEANYGATAAATWEHGDFNGDTDVDFSDYQALERNFGKVLPALPGDAVPAPPVLSVLLAGLAFLPRRRRA